MVQKCGDFDILTYNNQQDKNNMVKTNYLPENEIKELTSSKLTFTDFTHFEDDTAVRDRQKQDFIAGDIYVPDYGYPRLDRLYDEKESGGSVQEVKTSLYRAILELEANRDSGVMRPEEFDLYASFYELRLKKIMLVEAAKRLRETPSSSENEVARQEFMSLNYEVYGEVDYEAFNQIMSTEFRRVESFDPRGDDAEKIKRYLLDYFRYRQFEDINELPLLNDEQMSIMHDFVLDKYKYIVENIPDTGEDVFYDAEASRDIINRCLVASGLADHGWLCEIDPKRSVPATNSSKKRIFLPSNTLRNARQLRRLYIHEGEVHARRGQNGEESGLAPLRDGTADYADVEEGAGVVMECILEGNFDNESFHRARDRYIVAGLAMGIDGTPKDARATFEITWRLLAIRYAKDGVVDRDVEARAKKQATVHDDNAFRGQTFQCRV